MAVFDLRRPQGKYGGSAQALADLISTIQTGKRIRAERDLTEAILKAIGEGATGQEFAQRISPFVVGRKEAPTGLLQRLIEPISPSAPYRGPLMGGSDMAQNIMGRLFAEQFPTSLEKARTKSYEALTEQRKKPPAKKMTTLKYKDKAGTMRLWRGQEEQISTAVNEIIDAGGTIDTTKTPAIHTPHYIAQVCGELTTGAPQSILGLPLATLKTREDHIRHATNKLGEDFATTVPRAMRIIDTKFPKGRKTETKAIEQIPAKKEQGITATNPETGERVISYDGGQTWQPIQ